MQQGISIALRSIILDQHIYDVKSNIMSLAVCKINKEFYDKVYPAEIFKKIEALLVSLRLLEKQQLNDSFGGKPCLRTDELVNLFLAPVFPSANRTDLTKDLSNKALWNALHPDMIQKELWESGIHEVICDLDLVLHICPDEVLCDLALELIAENIPCDLAAEISCYEEKVCDLEVSASVEFKEQCALDFDMIACNKECDLGMQLHLKKLECDFDLPTYTCLKECGLDLDIVTNILSCGCSAVVEGGVINILSENAITPMAAIQFNGKSKEVIKKKIMSVLNKKSEL